MNTQTAVEFRVERVTIMDRIVEYFRMKRYMRRFRKDQQARHIAMEHLHA